MDDQPSKDEEVIDDPEASEDLKDEEIKEPTNEWDAFNENLQSQASNYNFYDAGAGGDCGPRCVAAFLILIGWKIEDLLKVLGEDATEITHEAIRKIVANEMKVKPIPGKFWTDNEFRTAARVFRIPICVVKFTRDNEVLYDFISPNSESIHGENELPPPSEEDLDKNVLYLFNTEVPPHFQLLLPSTFPQQLSLGNITLNRTGYQTLKQREEASKNKPKPPSRTVDDQAEVKNHFQPLSSHSTFARTVSWLDNKSHPVSRLLQASVDARALNNSRSLNNKDILFEYINLHQLVQSLSLQEGKQSEIEALTVVVGNQSAGKTTLCISLTGQVAFFMDENTATIIPTHISRIFDRSVPPGEITGSLTYKDQTFENLNANELLEKYLSLFGPDPSNPNQRRKVMPREMCKVQISSASPVLGIAVLDNPGFVLNKDLRKDFENNVNTTMKDHIIGDSKSGILLIVNSIKQPASEAGWLNIQGLQHVPGSRCFVAVTRMDEIPIKIIAKGLHAQAKNRHMYEKDGKKIKVSPLQILKFIEGSLKAEKADNGTRLPDDAQFFFVASCSAQMSELSEESADKRFHRFLHDKKNGQNRNMKAAIATLTDKTVWKQENITLRDMNDTERREFDSKLGVPNLGKALIKEQTRTLLRTYERAIETLAPHLEYCRNRLLQAQKAIRSECAINDLVPNFIDTFVQLYHTLAHSYTYTSNENSGSRKNDVVTKKDIQEAVDYLKDNLEFGYSLEQVDMIYAQMQMHPQFPPSEYQVRNYDEVIKKYRPKLVRPADLHLNGLTGLIDREVMDYALKCSLLQPPAADSTQILRELRQFSGVSAPTPVDAIFQTIKKLFNTVYADGQRGGKANIYTSLHIALPHLLHAQVCLQILSQLTYFAPVLRDVDSQKSIAKIEANVVRAQTALDDFKKEASPTDQGFDEKLAELENQVSEAQENFSKEASKLQKPTVDILQKLSMRSKVLGNSHSQVDLAPSSTGHDRVATLVETSTFVNDAFQKCEARRENREKAGTTRVLPFSDLAYVITAMFFDEPYESMHSRQSNESHALELTQPMYLPMLMSMAPLFIHSDSQFLAQYAEHYPKDAVTLAFLKSDTETQDKSNVNEYSKFLPKLGQIFSPVNTFGTAVSTLTALEASHRVAKEQYQNPDAALFTDMSSQIYSVMIALNKRSPIDPEEKAKLLSSLMRMGACPDVPIKIDNKADFSEYDKAAISFSVQRFLSTGFFLEMIGVLKNKYAVSYPYIHPDKANDHKLQFYERLVSRLAGYLYPYLAKDRPLDQHHLEPNRVIKFLHDHLNKLMKIVKEFKRKQDSKKNAENEEVRIEDEDHNPFEEAKSQEGFIAGEYYALSNSPLLQLLLRSLASDNSLIYQAKIKEWYGLSLKLDPSSKETLLLALIRELGANKYDDSISKRIHEEELHSIQNELKSLIEVRKYLQNYYNVLREKRSDLVTAMIEIIENPDADNITTKLPHIFVNEEELEDLMADFKAQPDANDQTASELYHSNILDTL